jgi:deoxycytidylate deaminase
VISPSVEEYGMVLAATAAMRSLDLSRQVGASILTPTKEVIGLGANEVPAPGGGQYWGDPADVRDYVLQYDSNDMMKREILEEILSKTDPEWQAKDAEQRVERLTEVSRLLEDARVMNLTEFGRAVHAEMEAMLSASRVGVSPKGCSLYTTTFPCHNCAKHIIDVGIDCVVYIEPYPRSLAGRLHEDGIALVEEEPDTEGKVRFVPFLGIAPRLYDRVFSCVTQEGLRLSRKDRHGVFKPNPLGLRVKESSLSYLDRETEAALAAQLVLANIPKETGNEEA